jgi:hypothetical protein
MPQDRSVEDGGQEESPTSPFVQFTETQEAFATIGREAGPDATGLVVALMERSAREREWIDEMTRGGLRAVHLTLCRACRKGAGGECHTPGCSLWMNRAPDIPVREAEDPVPAASLAAMAALGNAWRGDWSEFDGRTLRSQLDDLDPIIRGEVAGEDVSPLVATFYASWDICDKCRSWTMHCSCATEAARPLTVPKHSSSSPNPTPKRSSSRPRTRTAARSPSR